VAVHLQATILDVSDLASGYADQKPTENPTERALVSSSSQPISRLFRLSSSTHQALIFIHGTQFRQGIDSETPNCAARSRRSASVGGYVQTAASSRSRWFYFYIYLTASAKIQNSQTFMSLLISILSFRFLMKRSKAFFA
jgi:hypothetical protein